MHLLEREAQSAALADALGRAGGGRGSVVLVAGEAGGGKSALVRQFVADQRAGATVWWGACDALDTPRPLGPLHDIARTAGGGFAAVMASASSAHERYAAFLDALAALPGPGIVVIEDAHWADDATRDALVFIARRIGDTRAMLVVTFRDDEVDADHPLRRTLGQLATLGTVDRVTVTPLSPDAVSLLVGPGHDPARVHEVTGGNPFFVTELVAAHPSRADAVPATVSDAVLARAATLGASARAALTAASMVPESVDVDMMRAITDDDGAAIDECVQAGLLVDDGERLSFRHELARLAIAGTVAVSRRQDLHAAILTELMRRPDVEPARLAHHAEAAGDNALALEFAQRAGDRAHALGARREAAQHYEGALRFADRLRPEEEAELLERYAVECSALGRNNDCIVAQERAIAIWRELGEVRRLGRLLALHASPLWRVAQPDTSLEAIDLLEPLGPGPELAVAYSELAQLLMLRREVHAAIDMGRKGIELSERFDESSSLISALNALGSALWFVDPAQAEAPLLRAMELSRAQSDDDGLADAMVNMGSAAGEVRQYGTAEHWLRDVIQWGTERDQDALSDYGRAWLIRVLVEQGRWGEADALVGTVPSTSALIARIVATTAEAKLRVRRGDPGSGPLVEKALELAGRTGDLQRMWPAAAVYAESAWLGGRPETIESVLLPVYEQAVRLAQPWPIGELAFWLERGGALPDSLPGEAAEPYRLQLEGDWNGAAAAWAAIGCPYEVALALADGDDDALVSALDIFGGLGAAPVGDLVAARMRDRGIRHVPRRPSKRTLANPAGLTDRELDVLAHLAAGRTNPEIAAELHISAKTAGHHVSAILEKLGVHRRRDAVGRARELDIPLPPEK